MITLTSKFVREIFDTMAHVFVYTNERSCVKLLYKIGGGGGVLKRKQSKKDVGMDGRVKSLFKICED